MERNDFEKLVEQVLATLPSDYAERLHNLVFLVEDQADPATLSLVGFENPEELLGFFDGIPLTERTLDQLDTGPARIYLFQHAIEEEACHSALPLTRVIRETLWHEIAHYFGFSEDEMERIEALWAAEN